MSPTGLREWSGSLHQTFRLLPRDRQSPNLRPFLEGDGLTQAEILARLPYDRARSGAASAGGPDPRRFRDGKQVYQTVGLLYEDDAGRIRVTSLGKATLRWLDLINPVNRLILARHAAYALAVCQLRNPTGAGRRYDASVDVSPFAFIWRAMLALDGRITSDEINRGLFRVTSEGELAVVVDKIRDAREKGDPTLVGPETITGTAQNDRIIPWLSLASFGWVLFPDKRGTQGADYYELDPETTPILREAARTRVYRKTFENVGDYVNHIAEAASLPEDLR